MTVKLTEAQIATLREMKSYRFDYNFRHATSKKLAALGLAEALQPLIGKPLKRPCYRITQAGLAALKETDNG